MTETGWWLAKTSRTRANTTIPRISAATPMLLRVVSSRTPKALMTVETRSAISARNDQVLKNGIRLGAARSIPKRGDMTYGTVAATAVTVSAPAQK